MIDYLKLNSEKYQNKVAVVCGEEKITFGQLYEKVMETSRRLSDESLSVIHIKNIRNIDTIVAMLAAVAAGKTYRVVNDISEVSDEDDLSVLYEKETPLYQVSTSGTTGKKKLINKNGLLFIRFMIEFSEKMDISAEDVILNQLEFTFDASAKDIYLMVITGATLCIGIREKLNFPTGFMDVIENNKVTIFQTTPFFIKNIYKFDGFAGKIPQSLRLVMFVGDMMKSEYLNYWISKLQETSFVNLYGTSETIGNLMYHKIQEEVLSEYVPLTDTFCGYISYINEENVICFRGSDGEDIVTEDMAKKADEKIFITGRIDNVRKIRGYRVSLEEIESVVSKVLEIDTVLCEIVEDEVYVIFECREECDRKKIQTDIRKNVPKYLQPIHIKQVNELPVNANGKLNRKKIAEYF